MRVARSVLALAMVFTVAGACGGEPVARKGSKKPESAGERARAEKAASNEEVVSGDGKKWSGWRYQGRRDDCFFLVKRKCFDARAAACAAAKCGKKQCVVEGGGPATVRCE